MITLLTTPPNPALSRNPVTWKFRVTDGDGVPYGPRGNVATLEAQAGSFLVGNTFSLSWEDQAGLARSITFSCVANPTTIVQVTAAPVTLAHYEAIAAKVQAHYIISPLFDISAEQLAPTQFALRAVARETNHDFLLAWDDAGLSGTTTTSATTPVPDNTPDNLALFLDVFFEQEYEGGDYRKSVSLRSLPSKQAGEAIFNLSNILDREIARTAARPPLPVFSASDTELAQNLRNYYVRYRQQYDGASDFLRDWQYLGTSRVLWGGISQALSAQTTDYMGNINAGSSLLTWYPDGKTVAPQQPEWLPWYNYTLTSKNVILEVKRFTEEEQLNTFFAHEDGIAIQPGETALIPAGPEQIDLADTVVKYTVRIVDETSDWEEGNPVYLSPARTFYIDRDHYDEQRFLMYLNGFGVPCTLRCIGEHSKELEIERQIAERTLMPDYDDQAEELFQFDYFLQQVFTFRTGFLTRAEIEALQEMLAYNHLYEVDSEGYIPLLITADQFRITETRQSLHSLEIPCRPRLRAKMYSGDTSVPMMLAWRTTGSSFWQTTFGSQWQIA
jgi:hypothetical protein